MSETNAILDVQSIGISFGWLKAVQSFALQLREGALDGLIGPNGAGKTTVFNLLTGVYQPDTGDIRLQGKSIRGLKPNQIARSGMARTFQNIRLFGHLSVLDNVKIACHSRGSSSTLASLLRLPSALAEEAAIEERAMELLTVLELDKRADEVSRTLPYGDQRRLEIARALALDPRVLLLDEPAAGMNPQEKVALRKLIRDVRERFQLSVLLIEHDMGLVMDICEQITVLDHGQIICCGEPHAVQADPAVIEAYLGAPAE